MRVKAIMFKANGNEIKEAFVELNKWFEGVYYTNPDKEDYNSVNIYFEKNGVYAQMDRCSETSINEANKERIKPMYADLENWMLSLNWINLVQLEFAKQIGLDYKRLLERREQIKAEREVKKLADDLAKQLRQGEANSKHAEEMQAIKDSLKEGNVLRVEKVLYAIEHFKYKVHPRTLGTLNKINGVISITSATKPKGMNWNTHSSIIQTVKEFANS